MERRSWLWSAAALAAFCSECLLAEGALRPEPPPSDAAGKTVVTRDARKVWVLGRVLTMSEAGPVVGLPEVSLYEITCTDGRLNSMKRTYTDTHFAYGSATWTVELDQSPQSAEGPKALRAALDAVCRQPH